MLIDFSLIKNIDFTNKDNLIFLSIFLILTFAVIFIVFEVVIRIVRFFRKLLDRMFNQEEEEQVQKIQEQKKPEEAVAPPMPKIYGGDVIAGSLVGDKVEMREDHNQIVGEKEKMDIEESLEKLKIVNKSNLVKKQEKFGQNTGSGSTIKMPTQKQPLGADTQSTNSVAGPNKTTTVGVNSNKETPIPIPKQNTSGDSSIFGGEKELSRVELKEKLRKDSSVWKAGVKSKFYLSRDERAKLEKDLFSNLGLYGRNISKRDFQTKIKLMNREKTNAHGRGDYAKHEKLRKEISFLKKISGIK